MTSRVFSAFAVMSACCLAACEPGWVQHSVRSPTGTSDMTMAFDAHRNQTVLFGSKNGICEWNGTSWNENIPTGSTVGLSGVAVFDSIRNVTVLFEDVSGLDGPTPTMTWDGTTLATAMSSTRAPVVRGTAAAAFDSHRGVAVLFGGQTTSHPVALNDTWEWNGSSWKMVMPATSPSPRFFSAMAYDSAREVTVLFGGSNAGDSFDDTWTWDGTNWTQHQPAHSPPPHDSHGMAFDSKHSVVVLFGGESIPGSNTNGQPLVNDTWEWDGTDWTNALPITAPSPRAVPAMAYDSARGETLLFGGFGTTSDSDLSDTWTYAGR